MEEITKIDLNELHFIVNNARDAYARVDILPIVSHNQDALYTLTAVSLVALYRNTLNEVKIEDTLLTIYTDVVKAIINGDVEYVKNLINLLTKSIRGDGDEL